MINAERIAEMKRLSAEATPGPWVTGKPLHAHKSYITRGSRLGLNVANAYHYEDAQFVAESRQFVPDIIVAYEEQAEEIAKLRETLIDIYEYTSDLTLVRMITRRHYDIPLEAE